MVATDATYAVRNRTRNPASVGSPTWRRAAVRMTTRFGRGFSYPTVKRMKQFYVAYPNGSTFPSSRIGSAVLSLSDPIGSAALSSTEVTSRTLFPGYLSWTHNLTLMRIESPEARAFYELETVEGAWSARELDRQIGSLLYELLAKSRDAAAVMALSTEGQVMNRPADTIRFDGARISRPGGAFARWRPTNMTGCYRPRAVIGC